MSLATGILIGCFGTWALWIAQEIAEAFLINDFDDEEDDFL